MYHNVRATLEDKIEGTINRNAAAEMSHSIRIFDYVKCEREASSKLNSTGKVLLYRDRGHGSHKRETVEYSPPWKCAVLGLPHELSQEVNSFLLIFFCSFVSK
jgi:hypothetical protein